ncbi:MAG TPA: GNAT family N-acetyltransferase [Candidatus Saccharimonadales bacterium]|nr:GNAT family N-acetyltransferase [Candidatus Saccharimonadales bacterium]
MEIRLARISDYEELMGLYNLFYNLPIDSERHLNPDSNSFEKVLKSPYSYIYVAEDNTKLVGFTSFSFRNVVRHPNLICQLEELFVLEEYRKHGIGKKFVEKLEIKSKELDCKNIYIESGTNLKTAHKFYKNLGYKKEGYYFKKILINTK